MYRKCPKCGYERKPADVGADLTREEETGEAETDRWSTRLLAMLTQVEPRTDRMLFWRRVTMYAVFVVWGCHLVTLDFRSN